MKFLLSDTGQLKEKMGRYVYVEIPRGHENTPIVETNELSEKEKTARKDRLELVRAAKRNLEAKRIGMENKEYQAQMKQVEADMEALQNGDLLDSSEAHQAQNDKITAKANGEIGNRPRRKIDPLINAFVEISNYISNLADSGEAMVAANRASEEQAKNRNFGLDHSPLA